MNGEIVVTFAQVLLFFSVLGWAVDTWLRSKIVFLYPAFGLLAFGVTAVPFTYLRGHFDLMTIYGSVALLLVGGVIGVYKYGLIRHFQLRWSRHAWLLSGLGLAYISLGLIQASQHLIPGGIDSAIHSSIIQGALIQNNVLPGTYPLGMHITILTLERLFDSRQELVFLSVYLLVLASALAGLAAFATRLTRWPVVGYAALAVGCLDVSLYNNLLNGSGTHLLGALGIILFLVIMQILDARPVWQRWLGLTAVFSFLWYFHYPTLFFGIITLWAWRIAVSTKRTLVDIAALSASMVISIPLQIKLFHDEAYFPAIGVAVGSLVVVELLLYFYGRKISALVYRRWTVVLIASLAVWLFLDHRDTFLYVPTWYGEILIGLAFFGIISAVLRPVALSITGLLSFAGVSALYALLNTANLPGLKSVMVELGYYFGFTISLMLLGLAGSRHILAMIANRSVRVIFVSGVAMYIILIMVSRSYDESLIDSLIPGDRPISRYESSGGFGIFYKPNDARLAAWVKENIPNDGIIANPGGLYNTWATLTERERLYAAYNVPVMVDPELIISNITKLLKGDTTVDLDAMVRRRVKYLLLPEQFATAVYHPRLVLLKQVGQARFYEIADTAKSAWLPIPIGVSPTADNIVVKTTGSYACRYCGNTFYFTQQDILNEARLGVGDSLTIQLPLSQASKKYEFFLDRAGKEVEVSISGKMKFLSTTENIGNVSDGDQIKITNHTKQALSIRAMGLREN